MLELKWEKGGFQDRDVVALVDQVKSWDGGLVIFPVDNYKRIHENMESGDPNSNHEVQ